MRELRQQMENRGIRATPQEVIARGLAANPQLAQAYQQIEEQRWNLQAAKRQWNPTFSLQNGQPFLGRVYSESFDQIEVNSDSSSLGQWQFAPGASLNWSFFLPTREPSIRAADASLRQQQLLFDVAARNLVLSLQDRYYSLQASREIIRDFERLYVINRDQVDMLQARFVIGLANIGDVHLSTTQLYQQLSDLVSSYLRYFQDAALLAQAAGLPPGQLILPSDDLEPIGDWNLTLPQTLSEGLKLREEIQASLASSTSYRWQAATLLRSTWPSLSIVAFGSLQNLSGFGSEDAGSSGGLNTNVTTSGRAVNRTWTGGIGLGFNWTLFDGGISAANARASQAQSRAAGSQADLDRLQVVQQLETAYAKYTTSQIAIRSAQEGLTAAVQSQKVARARLQVGVGDVTSVVQAIQLIGAAAQSRVNAVLAYNQSIAELYRYSAQWPPGTLPLVQASREVLK